MVGAWQSAAVSSSDAADGGVDVEMRLHGAERRVSQSGGANGKSSGFKTPHSAGLGETPPPHGLRSCRED